VIQPARKIQGVLPVLTPAGETPDNDSRSVLLEAALHCFAHRGFDGTSIRDIASKAARNSSLISHYFGCKEGLYEEVFRYVLKARKSAFGMSSGTPEAVPGDCEEAIRVLHDLIRILCSDFITRPEQTDQKDVLGRMLLLNELREPRPRVVSLLRELVAPWIRRFSDCLGILRPGLTEVQRKFLGISVMGEMMAHMMMQGLRPCEWGLDEFNSAQAVELLTDFNLRALGVSGLTLTRRDDQ
jgi:AcrR family transcriptional regulator